MVCELHNSKDVTSYFVIWSLFGKHSKEIIRLCHHLHFTVPFKKKKKKNQHLLHRLIIDWSSDPTHSLSFPPPAFGSCFWHVQWCREDEVQISFAAQALCYRPCLSAVGEPTGTMSQIDLLKMPILHKSSHFLETLKGFACCCFGLQRPMGVSLKQFDGLMRFYRPRMSARDRFLTFKALNTSGAPMLRWLPDNTDCSQLQLSIKPSVSNFAQNLIQVCSAAVWRTFISSMRSLALNGR